MRNRLVRPREERGSILVISTVGMVLAMISAGLAVDLGSLAQEARRNQKVADLAALDAARVAPADYQAAASSSAARNLFPTGPGYSVTAMEGVKVNGSCVAQSGAGSVCVTATSPHTNDFPFLGGSRTVSRSAVAGAGNTIGTVRVGSSLVSASGTISPTQDLLLDKTISSLIGGGYATDAGSWKGLANGSVTFSALTSALANVTGNGTFTAGTPEQVLNSTFTAAQLFTATAQALNKSGEAADVSVANSVQNIGAKADGTHLNLPLKLYDFFDFGSVVVGNKQDVANATLNVLDLIRGGAILANGSHFAAFTVTAQDVLNALGPTGVVPGGFDKVKISMGLIEAPQQSYPGPAGKDPSGAYYTSAHTSQVRVKLEVDLKLPLAQALTKTVEVPLVGPVTTTVLAVGTIVQTSISYYLNAGNGHAYLEAIHCGATAEPTGVEIKGVTDPGTSKVGFVNDTDLRTKTAVPVPGTETVAEILGIARVKTTGSSFTNLSGNPGEIKTFLPPYEDDSPSQRVSGSMLALPSIATTNLTVEPLVIGLNTGTLLSDLVSGINSTGLSLTSTGVGLTTSILKPLYDALGLSFGTADLWAPPVQTCAALSPVPTQLTGTPVLKG